MGWLERRCVDRPLEYRSALSWLLAGTARDLPSLGVGWLLGWGLLPLSVVGALAGAVFGAASGFSGSLESVDALADAPVLGVFVTWAWSGLGGLVGAIVGLVLGGLLGAILAFLIIPILVIVSAYDAGGVLQALMVTSFFILITVLLGMGWALWTVFSEGPSGSVQGYRRMSRREAELLVPMVHDSSARLGFRNAPRILVDDSAEANAYALTRHIVVTRGMLEMTEFDPEALDGVLCHELVHWHNGDVLAARAASGLALPAYLLYNLAALGSGRWIVSLVSFPLRLSLRFLFLPVQARDARASEYRADQGAVLAGTAAGLVRMLTGLKGFENGRSGWDDAVCATHPPTELRLERLEPHVQLALVRPEEESDDRAV